MFFVSSRAWDKEKIVSPHEEWNLRPSDSALPLSHRDSEVNEVYYEVHMTHICMHRNMYTGKTLHESVSVCTYSQTFVLS